MLNIGPMEFVAVCVIALIVLGPDKLPQAMRTLGRITRELRRISGGFQNEIRSALEEEPRDDERPRYDDSLPVVDDEPSDEEVGGRRDELVEPVAPSDNGSPDGNAK